MAAAEWWYEENGSTSVTYYIDQFTRCAKNPYAGRSVITIGVKTEETDELLARVMEYNKNESSIARIEMKYYLESDETFPDELSIKAAVSNRIYLDLLSGEAPDILMGFDYLNELNTETNLVDLNQFLDSDPSFHREEYYDNIFRAFETDGKLFHIPIGVGIETSCVNGDILGEKETWTYDEYDAILSSLPQDMSPMEDCSCNKILEELMESSGSGFVDYEKKETHFDSDSFKKILDIAKKYGIPDYDEFFGYGEWVEPTERMDNNLLFQTETYISDIGIYAGYATTCNGHVKFISQPGEVAKGMNAVSALSFAITAASANQQEAWDFIRFMLNEDQQVELGNKYHCIPIHRAALDQVTEDVIQEWDNRRQEIREMIDDPEYLTTEIEFEECLIDITPEMTKDFLHLVERIDGTCSTDAVVMGIIEEEAAGYFYGQRSVDEVCDIIQNRVQNLVQER